ncbi:hypothetical protein [Coxiella-like endosymbiont]
MFQVPANRIGFDKGV